MTARLTVLGGSSPSTAALIEALAAVNGPPSLPEITLYGRHAGRLGATARYARARLGRYVANVRSTDRLREALDGATLVLSQIRYGGLPGRADDEAFAEAFGLTADETLGPAALRCALRIAPALAGLGRALNRSCPDARVINLINPLSVSTAILAASGARCVGVCELPLVTARDAARALAVPFASLEWAYDGLNHRGFIHHLTIDGRDQLSSLLARLGEATINGISGRVIEEIGAIPLKYFRLLQAGARPAAGRAAFLTRLGSDVFRELDAAHTVPPPSLARRDARWYPDAVVPAIVALTSATPRRLVMNVPRDRDVVVEVKADVSADAVVPVTGPRPNRRVAAWLDRFERHERAVLRAVTEPEVDSLIAALDADPLLTKVDVAPMARALCGYVQEVSTPSWASA
jgi:6-phospho-beta-glucosidase